VWCKDLSNWTSGVGQKIPTPDVVRNLTPPKHLRLRDPDCQAAWLSFFSAQHLPVEASIPGFMKCICLLKVTWWLPHLFDVKPRLIMCFSSFRAAYNQRRRTFFSLLYHTVKMTLSFSLATSCRINSIFAFHNLFTSASCAHSSKRGHDEQGADVVVKHHY